MSIIAYGLLGDWQAILVDPCTKSSIFHHPELQQQYESELYTLGIPNNASVTDISSFLCEESNELMTKEKNVPDIDIYIFPTIEKKGPAAGCEFVSSCPICSQEDNNKIYSIYPNSLFLKFDYENQCFYMFHFKLQEPDVKLIYSCSIHKSQLKLCIYISATSHFLQCSSIEEYVEHVYIQTVQVLERRLALLAEKKCENLPHHSCHWNPHSEVTGRYCEYCPPICRDKSKYLQFYQFIIGAGLLILCGEITRIPMMGLLSDITDKNNQVYKYKICSYRCLRSSLFSILSSKFVQYFQSYRAGY